MNELPEEIFFRIFSFVNLKAFFIQLPLISKKFNALVRTPTACEPLFDKYFPDSPKNARSKNNEECYSYLSELYKKYRESLSEEQKKALNFILEDKVEALKKLVGSKNMPLRDLFQPKIVTFAVARNNSVMLAYLCDVIEENHVPRNKKIYAKSKLYWAVSLNANINKIKTLINNSPDDETLHECDILFDYIGKAGRLDLLKVVRERLSLEKNQKERVLKAAIAHSCLDIIGVLLQSEQDLINSRIEYYKNEIMYYKNKSIINEIKFHLTVFQLASAYGNLDVLNYLINNMAVNMDVELKMAIYIASAEGHFNVVKYLLALKEDNDFGPGEHHPLLAAAKYDHIKIVKYFIEERKLDCDVIYDYYSKGPHKPSTRTLLDVALEWERLDIVRYLLAKKAKTAESKFFHRAIVFGSLNTVTSFIEKIDVNEVDEKGWAPLHYAAKSFEMRYAADLLKHRKCVINLRTPDGLTPAFIALRMGNFPIFNFLINKKKNQVLDVDDQGNTLLHTLMIDRDNFSLIFSFKKTSKIIKNLIEKCSANVNARNHLGKTPLFLLVESVKILDYDFEYIEALDNLLQRTKYLVDKGADPNAIANDGLSVLNAAIVSECLDLVQYFIREKEVPIQLLDISTAIEKRNPMIAYELLLAAIRNNQIELVQYCIGQGVPLSNQNYCTTSLHFAAQCGKVDIFRYLLKNGNILVNRYDLQMVYNAGIPEITKLLINVVQGDQTFLLMAILENNMELVSNYISAGAEVNLGANGLTPLQAARHIGNAQIIQLLTSSGAVDAFNPPVPVNTAPQPQSTGKRPAAHLTHFFLPEPKRQKTTPEFDSHAPAANAPQAEQNQPRL